MYRQVSLHGQVGGGRDVAWIPSEFAKKGKLLTIDGSGDLWYVHEVYDSAPLSEIELMNQNSRDMRKVLGTFDDCWV
jgi:hypothetical protein